MLSGKQFRAELCGPAVSLRGRRCRWSLVLSQERAEVFERNRFSATSTRGSFF